MKNTVRLRRTELGMTQLDLADRLGVSRQTIISIERERYDPSLPLAFRLAATLQTTIEGLFTPNGTDLTD
ncbi:helix-turn-helix transcriptional regulator [Jonesiaceae bacterium BS-20]|uniref:Helix-turn-helix transcriptional regulator n=1 Tax=Jonesiaceae bacterium BS-20 TaxID=3120821 RepID=A0AAU7DXI8_9MICO